MTQEQKALAYDKALEIAKSYHDDPNCFKHMEGCLEHIFPELAESEDERIRKSLISFVRNRMKEGDTGIADYLAWLEKQGQKPQGKTALETAKEEKVDNQNCVKPVDKVEPKFHEGEWIIHQGTENIYQVVACIDNQYQLKYGDNYTVQKCADVDRCARVWDIAKDAKDGDVLHCWIDGYEFVLIYKGIKGGYITTYGHLYQNLKSFSEEPTTMFCRTIQGHFTPATKEQRDLLFQKMKEAGHEWDAEKKELKKFSIENTVQTTEIQKPVECKEKKYSKCSVYNLSHSEELCKDCEFNPKIPQTSVTVEAE